MREWKHEIRKRLAGSNLLPEREAEIIDELSAHLQDQYSQLCAGGATDEEAAARWVGMCAWRLSGHSP